jgi:predicted ATPase
MRETTKGKAPDGKALTPDDVAVLYIEPASDGTRVSELRIGKDGHFIDEWPDGFFEEGFREVFDGL